MYEPLFLTFSLLCYICVFLDVRLPTQLARPCQVLMRQSAAQAAYRLPQQQAPDATAHLIFFASDLFGTTQRLCVAVGCAAVCGAST